ncbi:Uncharacterized conserved protein YjgD, DUF1641 family [Halogeometricum rufum]|uniref:Uncharacterized conserved protein YjgD, DUF1641 family n=1 Tax=Halogeometricum rufum TaxID=553469 RepID=A0A1I6IFG6_9EURY|nr:DUF1641 domain-containing protein [Halogeometricum rufum]SFR65379.1 Uncharacterized conserved protein YjgD, DUF1641 family [Halogeometricum rufum]
MAKPQDTYPETATNGARKERADPAGEAAVREAVRENGDRLAAALDASDEVDDALTTAILMLATADEAELEHVTESSANLVEAADGLTTEGAAALANDVGENAEDLSESLETVLELQRQGHLEDLVTIATAFSESLSPEEVEELATMLEENGTDIVEAFDVVLELQQEGHLEDLVALAKTLSTLDIDDDTAAGIDTVLGAVGEAQRTARPVGVLGLFSELRSRDARAGIGYLVALLKAQGRRMRKR